MSGEQPERLKVALIYHGYGGPDGGATESHVRTLAHALREAGHEPTVLAARVGRTRRYEDDGIPVVEIGRLPERRLRSRALDGPITHLTAVLHELGGFHVAHAFSPQEAFAASFGPTGVAFTCVNAPRREALAARRLRLAFWERATHPWNGLVVPGEQQRDALRRWLAVEAEVAGPDDAAAHERVYRACWARAID